MEIIRNTDLVAKNLPLTAEEQEQAFFSRQLAKLEVLEVANGTHRREGSFYHSTDIVEFEGGTNITRGTWNKEVGFWNGKDQHNTYRGPFIFHIPEIGDFTYDSFEDQIARFEPCDELADKFDDGGIWLELDQTNHRRFIDTMRAMFGEVDAMVAQKETQTAWQHRENSERTRQSNAALLADID